jgi:hypothetical protein
LNLFPSTIGYPSSADYQWNEFFLNVPQCLGMSDDLSESGSFLTSIDLAVPILATQDEEGMFKAFVKSCRRRGVAVETGDPNAVWSTRSTHGPTTLPMAVSVYRDHSTYRRWLVTLAIICDKPDSMNPAVEAPTVRATNSSRI